jgi:cytochrome c1
MKFLILVTIFLAPFAVIAQCQYDYQCTGCNFNGTPKCATSSRFNQGTCVCVKQQQNSNNFPFANQNVTPYVPSVSSDTYADGYLKGLQAAEIQQRMQRQQQEQNQRNAEQLGKALNDLFN